MVYLPDQITKLTAAKIGLPVVSRIVFFKFIFNEFCFELLKLYNRKFQQSISKHDPIRDLYEVTFVYSRSIVCDKENSVFCSFQKKPFQCSLVVLFLHLDKTFAEQGKEVIWQIPVYIDWLFWLFFLRIHNSKGRSVDLIHYIIYIRKMKSKNGMFSYFWKSDPFASIYFEHSFEKVLHLNSTVFQSFLFAPLHRSGVTKISCLLD